MSMHTYKYPQNIMRLPTMAGNKMIYTTEIRPEDTKGISCRGCSNLIHDIHSAGIEMKCTLYPAMDNMIRCIGYENNPIEWVNYLCYGNNKKY